MSLSERNRLLLRAEKAEAEAGQLKARLVEFERLQRVWIMSPEAAKRLDGYRELAEKCAALEVRAEKAEAKAVKLEQGFYDDCDRECSKTWYRAGYGTPVNHSRFCKHSGWTVATKGELP